MKQLITLGALALPLMASAATNLLTNGSFEDGLNGWTVAASATATIAPEVIAYGPPGSAFGEEIPADNAPSLSPDAVGAHALYFVDDNSTQSVSQDFTVTAAGDYTFGFSIYVPANGFANPGDATFEGSFSIFSTGALPVSALPAITWLDAGDSAFLAAGTYTAQFSFATLGGQSKDVVIDRAFVTAVPEPETYALMLAGLCAVGFMARRRRA